MNKVTYPADEASREERRDWARQILRKRAFWETTPSGDAILEEAEAVLAEANREEDLRLPSLGTL
jgi:hypothetical protein